MVCTVCVHMYVGSFVCTYICTLCVEARECHYLPWSPSTLYFLRHSLSCEARFVSLASLASHLALWIPCPYLEGSENTGGTPRPAVLWVLRIPNLFFEGFCTPSISLSKPLP